MKITKWNEKVSAILDTMLEKDDAVYCNRDDGVVFANKQGTFAMFCPEHTVWTVKPFPVGIEAQRKNALSAIWDKTIQSDSKLADSTEIGTLIQHGNSKRKVRKFNNDYLGLSVYVQERFLRQFPANTLYYVSGRNKPVIAGIWENDRLYVIGFVLPIMVACDYHFIPAV